MEAHADELDLWIDDRISGGQSYPDVLEQRLSTSQVLLAVRSGGADMSRWCLHERALFIRRLEQREDVSIIPLRIDDAADPATGELRHLQHIDFRRYMTEGDRIFREELLPRLGVSTSQNQAGGPNLPGTHQAHSIRAIIAHHASSATPAPLLEHLVYLAQRVMQDDSVDYITRAALAEALSGLCIACGRLASARHACLAGISLLAQAGVHATAPASMMDEHRATLTDLYLRLAIVNRLTPVESPGIKHLLDTAIHIANHINQPILRRDKLTQAYREYGTWYQVLGRSEEALSMFRRSEELARTLPSQTLHRQQARIKQCQVLMCQGDVEGALAVMNEIDRFFHDEQFQEYKLYWQVYPHYLRTRAWLSAITNDSKSTMKYLDIHEQVAREHGLTHEIVRNMEFRAMAHASRLLPAPLKPHLFRLATTFEGRLAGRLVQSVLREITSKRLFRHGANRVDGSPPPHRR